MKTFAVKILLTATLLVVATPGVRAADFHEGLAAHRRGDYEAALREWRPLAIQGDVEAQYRLARMYYHGEGVKDDAEAARWYAQAAEQGHAKAQNNLGLLYEEGRGVERDPAQAVPWYRRAAEQGLATAQSNLARTYDLGLGVDRDHAEAAKWYRRAAEQGHAGAQYRLGVLFDDGMGVPRNPGQAAKWYRRAARQGNGPAQGAIGSMYAEGRGVPRDAGKAAKWLGRASAQGIAVALSDPAADLQLEASPPDAAESTPDGFEPAVEVEIEVSRGATPKVEKPPADPPPPGPAPKAAAPAVQPAPGESPRPTPTRGPLPVGSPELQEVSRRADEGDARAQYRLAQMFGTGEGAPQNLEDAARWYIAAAEQGHGMAAYKLAFLYLRGTGVPRKDYVQAYRWFSVSAELGIGDAGEWRDRTRRRMTEREIADSDKLIEAWTARERDDE
jgi:TPR repeat protein